MYVCMYIIQFALKRLPELFSSKSRKSFYLKWFYVVVTVDQTIDWVIETMTSPTVLPPERLIICIQKKEYN
jgi:hypothetical protein